MLKICCICVLVNRREKNLIKKLFQVYLTWKICCVIFGIQSRKKEIQIDLEKSDKITQEKVRNVPYL